MSLQDAFYPDDDLYKRLSTGASAYEPIEAAGTPLETPGNLPTQPGASTPPPIAQPLGAPIDKGGSVYPSAPYPGSRATVTSLAGDHDGNDDAPPPPSAAQTPEQQAAAADPRRAAVASAYQRLLGRSMSDADYDNWDGNDNFEAEIAASPEGRAYAARNGGPAGPTGQNGARWDANWFISNIGRPNTVAELVALESKITAAGGKLLRNAAGVAGKIQTPDGRIVDVMIASGLGGHGFTWDEGGGSNPAAGNSPPPTLDPSLLDPWGRVYTPPNTPLPDVPVYTAPDLPTIDPFKAPTPGDLTNDPGYQFRVQQGQRAWENSRTASRTIRGGGALADLVNYNQNAASQEYGDAFNRSKQVYDTNVSNQFSLWNTAQDKSQSEYEPRRLEYANRVDQVHRDQEQAWAQYQQEYKEWQQNRETIFDMLYRQSQLGLSASG